jgi:hypothetical protein
MYLTALMLFFQSAFSTEMTQQERNEIAAKLIPVITMLLLDDGTRPEKPFLTVPLPDEISRGSASVEVNGQAGTKIFVNGVESGIIGSDGKATIVLTFVDGRNDFEITLRDDAGHVSEALTFSIDVEYIDATTVDDKVNDKFGVDTSTGSLSKDEAIVAGNWYGEKDHLEIRLQLRKDGTYRYTSKLGIGKYHNFPREITYSGTWGLKKGNSQIVLKLPDVQKPLVLTNAFPIIKSPAGVTLFAGSNINVDANMVIDQSQNSVTAEYTQEAKNYMSRKTSDFKVPYFTMIAPKVNSEKFWESVGIKPAGYHYGRKLGLETEEWKYALQRIKDDPENYIMLFNDEGWQLMIGSRKNFKKDIQDPVKMYRWLKYFKDQMIILGKVEGTVLYVITGDAPAYWAGEVRRSAGNDAKNIPAKLIESRFPEVLERNPHNSFAGVFQMMDYLRMKYAPNVKLGYTLKTWGITTGDDHLYTEPDNGWDDSEGVRIMSEYLNNYEVQFDFLAFNYHPRSSNTDEGYKAAAKFFGAISKKLKTRDGTEPKLWIWKLSLWNKEQPRVILTNIDFYVDECNAIGVTLGHGNDLVKASGFYDEPDKGIYIKSWMKEYFLGQKVDTIPIHVNQMGTYRWKQ